jgi:hypothetical protein
MPEARLYRKSSEVGADHYRGRHRSGRRISYKS